MELGKYSIGVGDRFGREGRAQLAALQAAGERGVLITPVWNKSNREHTIIGSDPAETRRRVDEAVRASGWRERYFVDADHIGLATVDRFLDACDFFTIDVADFIGKPAPAKSTASFLAAMARFKGRLPVPGMPEAIGVSDGLLDEIARKYLSAVEEAGRVYRHIVSQKDMGSFVTEVSFDEASAPQTPAELFFILGALAREGIPAQTVAPKFSGAFLKGIDYIADLDRFAREFEADLAVLDFAREIFGFPAGLKLSIHSGSDKFSLYPIMHRAIFKTGAGLHLKTAGTTWLEEVIGLAASGGEGLAVAKEVYVSALARFDELAKPYLAVINIDRAKLPEPGAVNGWTAEEFVAALEHNPASRRFNPHFRQLIHIAFRIAAEMGACFTGLLERHRAEIASHVTENLFRRHIAPLFLGE